MRSKYQRGNVDYGVDAGFVASLSYCVAGSADQQQLKALLFHHRL